MAATTAERTRSQDPRPEADGARLRTSTRTFGKRHVLLGALLMAISIVLFEVAAQAREDRHPVFALARDVPEGSAITDDDLVVVRAAVERVPTVAAGRRAEIVGRIAAVPLARDTLLSERQLVDRQGPAEGEVVVAIPLMPDRVPPEIRIGDRVRLLDVGGSGGADADEPSVLVDGARVFGVREGSRSSDAVVVSVVVAAGMDARVNAAIAADRLAVSLVRPRP